METVGLTPPSSALRRQRGFSMVEMLIGAFILGIGALGMAALQVASAASGTKSRSLGTATLLAHNLLDRITAEGNLAQAERFDQSGTVTSTGWAFIDPAGFAAGASTTATSLYFDISSNTVAAGSPTVYYTVTWQRFQGVRASTSYAYQPFVVNVRWNEAVRQGSATVVQPRYFSVSRNVRL